MNSRNEKRAAKAGKEKNRTMAVDIGMSLMETIRNKKAVVPVIPLMIISLRLCTLKGLPFQPKMAIRITSPKPKR